MSNYLANIASRSSQSDSISVMPSYTELRDIQPQVSGFELFDETESPTESAKSPDNSIHKEQVQDNPDMFFPDYPQQQPSVFFHNSEEIKTENKNALPYFTQHIERMIVEDREFISEKTLQTGSDANSNIKTNGIDTVFVISKPPKAEPGNDPGVEKFSVPDDFTKVDNRSDRIKSEKKAILLPDVKSQSKGNLNEIKNSIRPARLAPVEPVRDSNPQVKKNNQAAPKLVIGKITVEIVPPVAQPAQKIITRVVQSPSNENHSKINRLSFGLGQL